MRSPKKVVAKERPKTAFEKSTASIARWMHIYLSMVSFAILFFFAVTGLTLNHADWFSGAEQVTEFTGKVKSEWVNQADTSKISKLELVEYLRITHGIKGYVSEFRIEERECAISFRGPGYSSDAYIDRDSGQYELSETRLGLMAIMNDLHKGRDTGSVWSVVVDASAILLVLVSLTGMIMIFFIKKKKKSGLFMALIGLSIALALYIIFVP
jgi:uncharacterized protein